LEGFPPLPSSELEEWILSRRETYRTLQVEGLYHLAKACLAQSEFERAVVFARRQLEIEPWREEAYQQLITALAMDGRRSEALRDFSIFSDLLDKELKVEPSPVTMQLVERIRSGALSQQPEFHAFWPAAKSGQPVPELVSANPPPHNLPTSLTRLIGRELEILQVKQFLKQQRLVILTGPGGVGKTRLALATATEVVEQFRDGVWFVELTPLDQEGNIPSLILRALGIDPPPMATGSQLLRHILNNRQMLLILDNCESLVAAVTELVQMLMQTCPYLKILATSRETFCIEGEVDFLVPSLDFPGDGRLPAVETSSEFKAVQMLVERTQGILPEFRVSEVNWADVAYICQRLDGIPLALELAASHLGQLSPAQLAARLDGSFHFLSRGSRTGVPRHQTLRATIDWSYGTLSSAERLLLARLGVFVGGWTLEAAEEVCAGEQIAKVDVMDLLMRLVNKSMVSIRRRAAGENRFTFLETMHQYAQEKLRQSEEEQLLGRRHLGWMLGLAKQANPRLHSGEHPNWLRILDAERENIFHSLAWAIDEEGDIPSGLLILIYLDLWWQRGRDERRVTKWFQYGISHWTEPAAETNPIYVESLIYLSFLLSEREQCVALSQQGIALAKKLNPVGERSILATAYYSAGVISMRWDPDPEAFLEYMNLADEAFLLIRDHAYPLWVSCILLVRKSEAYFLLGDLYEAAQLASKSWEIMCKIGYIWDASALRVLGNVAMKRGDFAQAREYYEVHLTNPPDVDGGHWLSGLRVMAELERQQGHYAQAIALLQDAIRHSRERFGFFLAIELLEELAYSETLASRDLLDAEDHLIRAACCWGAAEANRAFEELKVFNLPVPAHQGLIGEMRERLDAEKMRKAWKAGAAMNIDLAIQYALSW
jgi:predicted ATPase